MTPLEATHRIALTIQYDGSQYHGWQAQAVPGTVQGELERSLERLTGQRRPVVGSSRTDAGVHATGQVAAVDVPVRWEATDLEKALNAVLPRDIWIAKARYVAGDFHPRFHALARTYLYRLGLSPLANSPFHRPWCWPVRGELDRELLQAGAELVKGEHSFRAFGKSGQPKRGDRCTVHAAAWTPWEDLGVTFSITADRYLHHMVRYLVGTLVDVSKRRRPLSDVTTLLSTDVGSLVTSPPGPPEGLFLSHVEYASEETTNADLPQVGDPPNDLWSHTRP